MMIITEQQKLVLLVSDDSSDEMDVDDNDRIKTEEQWKYNEVGKL